ncbi:MAG: hypothetical protein C4530_14610 [Desulfobacteraceae bacterium]|nr:MAG: hypothetical protein C4530_14610 [Desulfobacteraceae bacterium]
MKYAKKSHIIICDDVREEKGNKISLMGLYQKNIIVSVLPTILKQLFVIVTLVDVVIPFSKLTMKVRLPGVKKPLILVNVAKELKKGSDATLIFGFAPLKITEIGIAEFAFYFDDTKRANFIHKIEIQKNENLIL